ncbi:universal stress protein [Nitrosomonas communis]|uniref:Nucleotide-binding universal stress protein, UspA family n=1 Tax=Nitrosomonas communis TaxID=44574 RepID=A0A1H2UUW6_9PROT|nr:universal stress protein [Nitrosomonas communis]SDW59933.1 Nucleotide-binding universal stress protein, UspA family [Nitrosomonas communis]
MITALLDAVNIASNHNAALCIVHSEDGSDIEVDEKTDITILEKAKTYLNELNVETRLLDAKKEEGINGISNAIAAATFEWGADALVVGTTNGRGFEYFYVGSVAEQLIAKVGSLILLVRPKKANLIFSTNKMVV